MKILCIVPYPTEGASNRYRVEQYLPYLEGENIHACVRPFVSKQFFRILYEKGRWVEKGIYFAVSLLKRVGDLYRALGSDVVFIHREACPVGPPLFEGCFWLMRKPIIFDFDDAIFLPDSSLLGPAWRFLKCSWKVQYIIRMSTAVIVANRYLENYVRQYHRRVTVVPTVVDTEQFQVKQHHNENGSPVIGWIGTASTAGYLEKVFPVLEELSKRYRFILRVVGSSKKVALSGVPVENCRWSLEEDGSFYRNMDIGIYPLPDNPWARGKAAFKAIQYMAAGVPVVASPVGMNAEVIQDGVNGFLASTEGEWLQKLSLLVEQPDLRKKLGQAGRKTVEERYAFEVHKKRFLEILKRVSHADQ